MGKYFTGIMAAGVMALGAFSMSAPAGAKTLVDLGFAFDRSGSINSSDFGNARTALANAIATIPTNNPDVEYRIGVVSFGVGARTEVAPTLLTPASQSAILNDINSMAQTSAGATNMAFGINRVVADFAGVGDLGDFSLMNMTTDGFPNGTGNSTTDTQNAATAAFNAGWDSLSIEAVGSGANSGTALNFLEGLAFPATVQTVESGDPLPNPLQNSFVLKVDDFDAYEAAIQSKVRRIVDDTGGGTAVIPLPAAGWLLISAVGGMALLRRRRFASI